MAARKRRLAHPVAGAKLKSTSRLNAPQVASAKDLAYACAGGFGAPAPPEAVGTTSARPRRIMSRVTGARLKCLGGKALRRPGVDVPPSQRFSHFRDFSDDRLQSPTPGPPPFSSMNAGRHGRRQRGGVRGHAKAELKGLMPEDAKEAAGHSVRAKRSKSGAVSFDVLSQEAVHAPVQ